MKKMVTLFICLSMVCLVACGGNPSASSERAEEGSGKFTPTSAAVDGSSQPEQSEPAEEAAQVESSSASTAEASGEVTIEEQVLIDKDGIRVTATGLDASGMIGPELKLLIENESDQAVTVQTRDCSINGFMIYPMLSCEVQPGKKSNDSISFLSSELESNGIDAIGTIELNFTVFEPDTFETIFDSDTITIETSAAGNVSSGSDDVEKTIIFDQDDIRISFVDFDTEDMYGLGIKFYIENNSETPITVQARDTSINGYMLDGMMSADVMPGKVINTSLTFFDTALQDNGIEVVEEVELKLLIMNKDTWDTIVETDTIVLNS